MKYRALTVTLVVLLPHGHSTAQVAARDTYARYELLAPQTGNLRVVTDVTVASPGSKSHVESTPKGVEATDVSAVDLMTGAALISKQTTGSIQVELARPVPAGGESRIRIARTERNAASYRRGDDGIVFTRTLEAKRGSVREDRHPGPR